MSPARDARALLAKLAVGAALAVAASLVAILAVWTPFGSLIELKTYDWRMRVTRPAASPSDEVVIVAIDEDSIRRMAPLVGRWPWPRLAHASLVDFLARGGAKLVVYDVLFSERDHQRFTLGGETQPDGSVTGGEEWTGTESDRAFGDAIANARNVLLAADARFEGLRDPAPAPATPAGPGSDTPRAAPPENRTPRIPSPGACFDRRPDLARPIPAIAHGARGIGHTFLVLDDDGVARRFVPFVHVNDRATPSLAVAAVTIARALDPDAIRVVGESLRVGETAIPLVGQQVPDFYGPTSTVCRGLIPFRGPVVGAVDRSAFTEYSFYDLFFAENQIQRGLSPTVDPAQFKDRIVVVGTTASGTFDLFTVPHGQGVPGAYIHASVIDALLEGRTLAPARRGMALLMTLALALAVGLAGALVSPWLLAGLALAVAVSAVWLSLSWFDGGVWMPLVEPMTAIGLAFVGQLSWQYFVEGREKRQVKRLFSRYVPRDVYQQLMEDPSRAALGGSRRSMTVLFSDVRGFTSMSERATPEEIVAQLNEYFTRMVQVLFDHHGTLDKFVGDMVMGLFGAPLDDPDHADHAVQAALAMTRALSELNQGWRAGGRPELDIGIGVSTGDMVAGNIGSDTIMSYTVIGDTVNLGARLESLNKEYGTRIIISEATRAALKQPYDLRPLGEVTVKGKSRPVAIYEVTST